MHPLSYDSPKDSASQCCSPPLRPSFVYSHNLFERPKENQSAIYVFESHANLCFVTLLMPRVHQFFPAHPLAMKMLPLSQCNPAFKFTGNIAPICAGNAAFVATIHETNSYRKWQFRPCKPGRCLMALFVI